VSQRKAFLLRVSPALYQALERWAAEELRSVNGQIEYVLTQAVRQSGRARGDLAPPDGAGPAEGATPDATETP